MMPPIRARGKSGPGLPRGGERFYATGAPCKGIRIQYSVRRTLGAAFVLVVAGCTAHSPAATPGAVVSRAPATGAVTDHVVVISIDGLRPDAISEREPTLQRLMHDGATARVARTILPSTTLPSHTSMLTGVPPAQHGVTWNSDDVDPGGTVGVPTVFELAHAAGFVTAGFFAKSKFRYLERKGSLDEATLPGRHETSWTLPRTLPRIERYLTANHPNLIFIHIGEPDYAGHGSGWMGPAYLRAVEAADEGVTRIMNAADQSFGAGHYTLIVTADHGGHSNGHGTSLPVDMTIPWMAWGEGVQAGHVIADTVHTMDTAATALWLLGVARPAKWVGVAQAEAFTDEARAKALRPRGE